MSSFLCLICHNAVNSDTTEDTREKYREVIGLNLCPDSALCYICCHMVSKLWLFKSICLKRTLEYPVLFSEKRTINLHRSGIEKLILCEEETCATIGNDCPLYRYNNDVNSNDYVELEDEHNDCAFEEPYLFENKTEICVKEETVATDDVNEVNDNFENNDCDFDVTLNNDLEQADEEELNEENKDGSEKSETSKDKTKKGNSEKTDFKKYLLNTEEQKSELESQRRSKKYLEAEFKCYNCALGFLFKDSYQAHMMRHEESNGEFVCVLCTLRFASLAVLRAHRTVHRERYKCRYCEVSVRKRQRDTHARKCHRRERDSAACHLCGNIFQDASGLQQHIKRFHLSKTSNRTYSCNVCGKTYNNQAAVRTHMVTHVQRKFTCDQCNSTFSSPYTLTQHKKKHQNPSNDKEFMCETCGVGYATRKSLLAHMRTALQHQDRAYDCPICNKICPNSRALSLHLFRIHSNTKDYECPHCNRKYSCRKSLVRHVSEHISRPNNKMAVCYLCGKSFKSNSKLNRHLREVCRKNKLEEELNSYTEQQDNLIHL